MGWRRAGSVALLAVVAAACSEPDATAPMLERDLETVPVASARLDGSVGGGNPHFFFLPPTVETTPAYSGVFDGSVLSTLRVEVCRLGAAGVCDGPPVATYTDQAAEYWERIRVSPRREQYVAYWDTGLGGEAGAAYRVRVLSDDTELGHTDVAMAPAPDGLALGSWLPVAFRIEEGALDPCREPAFADPALETRVRQYLRVDADAELTPEMLARLTSLSVQNLGITDLSGLECLTGLRFLSLGGNPVADLSPVGALDGLERLYAQLLPIGDYSFLAGLSNLRILNLGGTDLSSLEALAPALDGLETLYVPDTRLTSLDGLVSPTLRTLSAGSTPLSSLAGMDAPALEQLSLRNSQITAVAGLRAPSLRRLELQGNPLADLTGLADGAPALTALYVGDTPLTTLDGIGGHAVLSSLDARDAGITDLHGLRDNLSLQTLHLGGNALTSLDGVEGAPSLHSLTVDENELGDLDGVDKLAGLQILWARSNRVADVESLKGHPSLSVVQLGDNLIGELDVFTTISHLRQLGLRDNPLDCHDPAQYELDRKPDLFWDWTCINRVRINEINYDEPGSDSGEYVEIIGPAGTDMTGWSVVLYNGSDGAVYDTRVLDGTLPTTCGLEGVMLVEYPPNGIQNGGDAVALVGPPGEDWNSYGRWWSYELGEFKPTEGPAAGRWANPLGLVDAPDSPAGWSLQLFPGEPGQHGGDWFGPAPGSPGECNTPP